MIYGGTLFTICRGFILIFGIGQPAARTRFHPDSPGIDHHPVLNTDVGFENTRMVARYPCRSRAEATAVWFRCETRL